MSDETGTITPDDRTKTPRKKTRRHAPPGPVAGEPAAGGAPAGGAGAGDPSGSPLAAAGSMVETMLRLQAEAAEAMLAGMGQALSSATVTPMALVREGAVPAAWSTMAEHLAALWAPLAGALPAGGAAGAAGDGAAAAGGPDAWRALVDGWYRALPLADEQTRARLLADSMQLWNGILGQYGLGEQAGHDTPELPRQDRRFADPRWRDQPVFALLHQAYLLLAEQLTGLGDQLEGLDPARRQQVQFVLRTLI
ncbi:MAG: hypothetical protein KGL54_07605, partial [Sphingomonadales bacterium]|nr:hypothetical protein [Sphingomonadales bacterium]